MAMCIYPKCNNEQMTYTEREKQFSDGWVGITMYENICSRCFNEMKEII